MNEVAVEKIVDLIHKNNLIHSLLSIPSRHLARKILRELEELGYRKPQEKPRLLSDKEIKQILALKWLEKYQNKFLGSFNFDDAPEFGKAIAQAQLDICIKHYEGG